MNRERWLKAETTTTGGEREGEEYRRGRRIRHERVPELDRCSILRNPRVERNAKKREYREPPIEPAILIIYQGNEKSYFNFDRASRRNTPNAVRRPRKGAGVPRDRESGRVSASESEVEESREISRKRNRSSGQAYKSPATKEFASAAESIGDIDRVSKRCPTNRGVYRVGGH